jgi:XTP/dITP diphosphohydrolase
MSISRDNKLLIASNNKGKVEEIKNLLKNFEIDFETLADKDIIEPDETESTFAGNALLKARYYGKMFNLSALADDSGLSILSLDGFPGVYSARVAREEKDFSKVFEIIKHKLEERKLNTSAAYFSCALALWMPSGEEEIYEAELHGDIIFPPVYGSYGFGYAPIFKPKGFDQRYSEIDDNVRNSISHRAQAFKKFIVKYS